MELEAGVFYQASCDGTEVAIIADYSSLLPTSHVSNQETYPSKGFTPSTLPTTQFHALKGRQSARHAEPKATRQKAVPMPGRLSKINANGNMAKPF